MLPVILATLARLGAGAAARLGASGVARSLVAAGRTAGPAAARAAAARGGSAAAATAASEGTASAGGFRVLENSPLNNAKAIFNAIYGRTAPAGTQAAAAQASPAQQVQAAAQAAQQQSSQAAAASPRGVPPTAPPPAAAPPPPAQPPPNWRGGPSRAQNLLDKTLEAWQRAKDTYQAAKERFTPVAERVAKLSLDERYARLQSGGRLPNTADVARVFNTPVPSRQQIVQHGENEEERQRLEEIRKSNISQAGAAVFTSGKKLAGAMSSAATTPLGFAKVIAAAYASAVALEKFGRAVSEGNRDLRQFNGRLADSFGRLDFAQLRSRQRLAAATSGSGAFVNDQMKKLTEEMQPLRDLTKTMTNIVGGSGALLARGINQAMRPFVAPLNKIAKWAEWWMGKTAGDEIQGETKDFLRAIRDGKFKMPMNPKPGKK